MGTLATSKQSNNISGEHLSFRSATLPAQLNGPHRLLLAVETGRALAGNGARLMPSIDVPAPIGGNV